MENYNYYFIRRKDDKAYPLIKIVDEEFDEEGNEFFYLEFNSPVPRNPILADYLSGPEDFLSHRIVNIINTFDVKGVKFLKTELTDNKGNLIEDYLALSVDDSNKYEAMDKTKSKYKFEFGGYWISKLVLDKGKLASIPLDQRLIFRLREAPGYDLYHESIMKAIMELEPTGMYFQNIEEYTGF